MNAFRSVQFENVNVSQPTAHEPMHMTGYAGSRDYVGNL